MSRIGKIFIEAAKHPESWKWETSSHIRHLPTRTTLYTPGFVKFRTYDGEVWLGVLESIVIRFRMMGWRRKLKKQRKVESEAEEFQRISNAMLNIEK